MKTANTVCLVVLCLVQTVLLWPNHDISTLKVLQVVHRHGDRSPVHFLPKDPFKNVSEYWPEGGGQLSNSGKLRMYRLGQFLRNEYQEFLGQAYSPREVYARSSLSHRCLESVEQVLAGAFPPNNTRWQWSNGTDAPLGRLWQPIPIESFIPKENDTVLDVDKYCPKADQELKRIFKSEAVLKVLNDNMEFLSELSQKVGTDVNTLNLAERVFSDLEIEHSRGLKWSDMRVLSPEFEAQVIDKLKPLAQLYWNVKWNNTLIEQVRAGPLIDQLANNFGSYTAGKPIVNSLQKPYKLFVYSTHDSKLAALMHAFQIFDNQLIPFGATLILELHHNITNGSDRTIGTNGTDASYFVKIYYYNSTTTSTTPYLLTLPACAHQQQCSFDKFSRISRDLIPSDWNAKCGIEDTKQSMFVSNIVALIINVALLLVLSGLIIYNCYHKQDYNYIPIESSVE